VLDYLEDLRSDFAVFYRIDELEAMPGPRMLAYAWRVSAYNGVMRARVEAEQQRRSQTADGRPRQFVSESKAREMTADEGIFETVTADG
jgi:hypothetical protein